MSRSTFGNDNLYFPFWNLLPLLLTTLEPVLNDGPDCQYGLSFTELSQVLSSTFTSPLKSSLASPLKSPFEPSPQKLSDWDADDPLLEPDPPVDPETPQPDPLVPTEPDTPHPEPDPPVEPETPHPEPDTPHPEPEEDDLAEAERKGRENKSKME